MAENKKIDEVLNRRQEKQLAFQKAVEVLVKLKVLIPADAALLYHDGASKLEASGFYIINNFDFNPSNLTPEELREYHSAINVLMCYEPTELAPPKFEERRATGEIYKMLNARLTQKINDYDAGVRTERLLTEEDIAPCTKMLFEMGFSFNLKRMVADIAGALNARELLAKNPSELVSKIVFKEGRSAEDINAGLIEVMAGDGTKYTAFISQEYVYSWLVSNQIIGVSKEAFGTGENNYFIFDTEKVNTEKAFGDRLQSIISKYGEFAQLTQNLFEDEKLTEFLTSASPEETMEVLRADENFKMYFDLWSGVREGFSIGEHTETTIRVFEDSFAKTTPKELAPFVKMALACHDIGKGLVNNMKTRPMNKNQAIDEATTKIAGEYCDYYGMNESVKNMLIFSIVEAQKYTSRYYIHEQIEALDTLEARCREVLAENLNREPTEAEISGFVEVCKILQACDSGAYTRYGITRDETTGRYYRNMNDNFTKSFHTPTDIRKRSQHLIEPYEPHS